MRPKIDKHDYSTKSRHVERFLRDGSKVKATIMFRGREMAHQELGRRLLDQLAADMEDIAYVESAPNAEGRNMTMVLAPHKDLLQQTRESGRVPPLDGSTEQAGDVHPAEGEQARAG